MNKSSFEDIVNTVALERFYQIKKWGDVDVKGHEVGAWISLMRTHLDRAEKAWAESNNDANALGCIRKVVTLGFACGEQHGLPDRV